VCRIASESRLVSSVVSINAERYDSGKGDRHVLPLSGRCGATSRQR
jgi:hypothetical protein